MRLGYMTAASLLLAVPGAANAEWKIYAQETPGGPWQYKITKQDNQGRQATMRGCTGMRGNHASKGVNQATGEEYVVVCSQVNGAANSATTPQPSPTSRTQAPASTPQTASRTGGWVIYHQKVAGGAWVARKNSSVSLEDRTYRETFLQRGCRQANYAVKAVKASTGQETLRRCGAGSTAVTSATPPAAAGLPSPKKQILDYAREIDKGGLLGRVLPQDE